MTIDGERGGSVVECRTQKREVGGSKPTAAVLCPWARHFTPRKYWLLPRKQWLRPDMTEKIVDWDVKPQHKQNKNHDNNLSYAMPYANNKDTDQPAYLCSLSSAFVVSFLDSIISIDGITEVSRL